mgnify:CR=1 FL=1
MKILLTSNADVNAVDEDGETALYLASSASDFVTGQTFIVDGGVTIT